MNKPILTIPAFKTKAPAARWVIESSHMAAVPDYIDADDLPELRGLIQEIADSKKREPRMGEIEFRYQLDDKDEVSVVHCYFINRHDKRIRFMRLSREPVSTPR